jgi:hypothetical protein
MQSERRSHLVVAAVALLGFAFIAQAQSNTAALLEHIRQVAGPNAKDCGQAGSASVVGEGVAEPCLIAAFQNHTAAFWIQNTGRAIVVTASGAVHILPSGYSCLQPFVATEYGSERLRCRENYSPPYRAAELPLRTGAPAIVAPRPMAPLRLDPVVCGSGKPGEHAAVEFVVSEEGKVLLADVLTAPKPCDVSALAANLLSVRFAPGTFRGTPTLTAWFTMVSAGP